MDSCETRPLPHCSTIDRSNEENGTNHMNQVIVKVYWQDRCLPETTLSALPFFPNRRYEMYYLNRGLTPLWRSRLVIFLFFNYEFEHISNNKLKILSSNSVSTGGSILGGTGSYYEAYLEDLHRNSAIAYFHNKLEHPVFLK
jgi:hypothetical protein